MRGARLSAAHPDRDSTRRRAGVIAGLVLAAGAGTRFGAEPKQLAELGGRPLLEWPVRAACEVGALGRIVVVLGAHAQRIRAAVDFGRAEVVVCDDWARGRSASLRHGVRALTEAERIVVTLGDTPLVTSAAIERFTREPPRTRAVYHGRPGHPVVLGPEQAAALTGREGDAGARGLLRGGPVIEMSHICCGRDVDTPDDLEEVRDEARAIG